ncbi:hypothetical protein ABZZ20_24130 [Streptomyces sp. NPDC006430]|uniref:hypothetical protein n=1 Tax=Streptomyces sp. NPDC006430 TaxID=3154299 RepID=UPI0033ACD751
MYRTRNMQTIAAAVAAMTAVTATIAMTGPAQARDSCRKSSKSVDTPTYSGPFPDNWEFTVTACARRSGGRVGHYATISWNLPGSVFPSGGVFNSTGTGLEVQARSGGSVRTTAWTDLHAPLDRARDGSHKTRTVTVNYGAGRAATGVVLYLDWKNDGKGSQKLVFASSPTV